jgi:hypothetical protein
VVLIVTPGRTRWPDQKAKAWKVQARHDPQALSHAISCATQLSNGREW